MQTLGDYIKTQYAIEISERYQQMMGEGLETTPSDFRHDIAAMHPRTLTAKIVTDNEDEVVLSLILKKSKESIT